MPPATPRFLLAGCLTRDYMILPSGEAISDVPGGSALYAAVGVAIWESDPPPAIVARVGEDYPQSWLENFEHWGIDTRGVKVLPEALDVRFFLDYTDPSTRSMDEIIAHYARLGLSFPKSLLGYRDRTPEVDSRTRLLPISLRLSDIPTEYLEMNTIHLCPIDYLTHSLLPAALRQSGFTTITVEPSSGYMNPTYWHDVQALLTGLTAFLPSEEQICSLFQGQSDDLWEMAEALGVFNCEFIVIKRGELGQYLYDAVSRARWEIPPYPARVVNLRGTGDAFCGGFLAGYRRTFDPLQAVLHGNISASLVMEGHTPNYALEALPGLPEARLEALRQNVRKV